MSRPLLLFAPGAGLPSTSDWMNRWADLLGTLGEVERFDYPYRIAGRQAPDKLPVLITAHRAALAEARRRHGGPVVLVGKSLGSRVGLHVSLEEPDVRGCVCLGYPLLGRNKRLRDQVLRDLRTPVLFAQGSRDLLCPPGMLASVRPDMQARNELFLVPGADHSLEVGNRTLAKSKRTQAGIDSEILATIASFVESVT